VCTVQVCTVCYRALKQDSPLNPVCNSLRLATVTAVCDLAVYTLALCLRGLAKDGL
jgi:hypothetical protein